MHKNLKFEIVRGAASILLALAVAMIFIFIISDVPFEALYNLIIGPFTKLRYLWIILERMIPIIFTGLGVCVMFQANQFNLAGEGTLFFGGLVAAAVAIYLPMPPVLHVIVAIVIASVVAAATMLIPALLKTKLGASEMVSSLMLNYILLQLGVYILNWHMADRTQGATMSHQFLDTARIPILVQRSNLSWGIVIALIMTVLVYLFMYRTKWGYAIRMVGQNQSFAKYSGIKVAATIILESYLVWRKNHREEGEWRSWATLTASSGGSCPATAGTASPSTSLPRTTPSSSPWPPSSCPTSSRAAT